MFHSLKLSTEEALVLNHLLEKELRRWKDPDPIFSGMVIEPIKRIKFKLFMDDKFELLSGSK